jgi:chromosome segregation protein
VFRYWQTIWLEQIGGIDPLVVEEYQETMERFEFLSGQSNDLTEASESLKKVILELDRKIEKIFDKSFKNISREFDKYFKIIFGGGKTSLKIKYAQNKETEGEDDISAEDAMNCVSTVGKENKKIGRIEISAVPPGKKITDLSMLSGGERALTSIAILFAIVANNPPPFSMLDEIDAALDEANSARLGKIIKELSSKTQFVMITHNRAIMNESEILYGVTMQEDGVSKILSLKLGK